MISPNARARGALDSAGIAAGRAGSHRGGHHDARPHLPVYRLSSCRRGWGPASVRRSTFRRFAPGFIYALGVAEKFFRAGGVGRALVVGADTHSRLLDWSDRRTCVLFGDGAGAVVLEASDAPGVMSTHLHADGRYEPLLYVDGGTPRGAGRIADGGAYTKMQGNEVFKVAVRTLHRIVDETLAANDMTRSDIDWLVPHQANIRIIEATARKLGMSMDRVIVTVEDQGNTSAASVPLALDAAVRDGRVQPGQGASSRSVRRRIHLGIGPRSLLTRVRID